jgi:hypothetical protein
MPGRASPDSRPPVTVPLRYAIDPRYTTSFNIRAPPASRELVKLLVVKAVARPSAVSFYIQKLYSEFAFLGVEERPNDNQPQEEHIRSTVIRLV